MYPTDLSFLTNGCNVNHGNKNIRKKNQSENVVHSVNRDSDPTKMGLMIFTDSWQEFRQSKNAIEFI